MPRTKAAPHPVDVESEDEEQHDGVDLVNDLSPEDDSQMLTANDDDEDADDADDADDDEQVAVSESGEDALRALGMFDPFDDDVEEGFTAVIYGQPGTGKTSLALTAPSPILLDCEKGGRASARAIGNKSARIVPVNDLEQLRKVYRILARPGHGFKTVILDPVGELQRLLLHDVIRRFPGSRRQYDDLPTQTDWNKMLTDLTKLILAFRGLPMNTIIVAHAQVPESGEDIVHPLASGKNFKPFLQGAMNLLGYLHTVEGEDGQPIRRLQTEASNSFVAKNRGGLLPSYIDNPNMTDIIRTMGGKL